ncbi:hypothetical protein [Tsukamurella hominis]|uniref:hypothetical protein n=1 Tax=Tsukamurella hominis TaxID=1970232 RepID=UPI0039EC6082
MPDSPPASASGAARIAGLVLAVAGAVGLVIAAFLDWYRVTARPPEGASAAAFALLEARVSGIGAVTMPAFGDVDVSSSVPNDVAWGGWVAIGLAVAVVLLAAVAALGPAGQRRLGAAGAVVVGVAGIALGVYAAVVPVGTQTMTVEDLSLQVDTKAGVGPYAVIVAAVISTLGALALLLARRSAPATVAHPAPQAPQFPASPFGPAAQTSGGPMTGAQQPGGQIPGARLPGAPLPAAPIPPHDASLAPSNPQYPPADAGWARPVAPPMPAHTPPPLPSPVPDEQTRTAVAPVAQRRPQPDWDRNWPGTVPPKPGPVTPSEQHTQVVKRPPRPVKVSPKPETEAIPRRDPRFDSPTQP